MPYRTWRLGECASATDTLAGKRGGGYSHDKMTELAKILQLSTNQLLLNCQNLADFHACFFLPILNSELLLIGVVFGDSVSLTREIYPMRS